MASDAPSGTWGGWLASTVNAVASGVSSTLGYDNLEVVNPDQAPEATTRDAPAPSDERQSFFASYRISDYIGKDVTSLLSVPVFIMEPFTMLQKMAEIMEYADLLTAADSCPDPAARLAHVVGFCVGPFGAAQRIWKPFNPILGETFQYSDHQAGVRYVAEQVSHHPPIGAAHAEGPAWRYDLVSAPKTRFLGNSVEVYPVGRTRIVLNGSGEEYYHRPPNGKAHNVLLGAIWVDIEGDLIVGCPATGLLAVLQFVPCGWFGANRFEMRGYITDKDGVKVMKLSGKWNEFLEAVACTPDGEPEPGAATSRIWEAAPKPPGDAFGFTSFALRLNDLASCPQPGLLPSDSRLRPDLVALAQGDKSKASTCKSQLEERQRAERRTRDAQGASWSPRWFRPLPEAQLHDKEFSLEDVPAFGWKGSYPPDSTINDANGAANPDFAPWQFDASEVSGNSAQ